MTRQAARVSVVMSAYNDAARVGRAVDSILAQTWTDLELIAINDGSSDETGAILDAAARRDPRVRVIHQENRGLTRSLIQGCELAQGEFIARQDADDWSHPRRIEKQLKIFDRNPDIGFVSCATEYFGPDDEFLHVIRRANCEIRATEDLRKRRLGPPAHGSVIFRTDFYRRAGGYREQFYFAQDADLWLRLSAICLIAYQDEILYRAQRAIRGASGESRGIQRQFGLLAQLNMEAEGDPSLQAEILRQATQLSLEIKTLRKRPGRRAVAAQNYHIGTLLLGNRDARCKAYFQEAVRLMPVNVRYWIRLLQSSLVSTTKGRDR